MKRLIYFLIILTAPILALSQQPQTGPKEKSVRSEMRSRKLARKEDREKRKLEKEERRAVEKHHKRIQTKAVRKRMKASRKKTMRQRETNAIPF